MKMYFSKKRILSLLTCLFLAFSAGCAPAPSSDLTPDQLYAAGRKFLVNNGDSELAREYFLAALDKQPDHTLSHMGMASIYRGELDFESAAASYEAAAKGRGNEQDQKDAWIALARLRASAGQMAQAERVLMDAYEQTGDPQFLEVQLEANRLTLSGKWIKDLTPLSTDQWTHLESLSLYTPNVEDYAPLSNLTQLEFLEIVESKASDLSFLGGMKRLEVLYLGFNKITDLTPLRGLANLHILSVSNNPNLSSLDGIEDLSHLEQLSIRETKVTDLTALSRFTKLWSLDISRLDIADFQPIRSCPIQRLYAFSIPEEDKMTLEEMFPDAKILF